MYDKIGSKIKTLAKVVFAISLLLSFVLGMLFIATFSFGEPSLSTILFGIGIMIVGSLIAWISTWFLYGFGELIDNTSCIKNQINNLQNMQSQNTQKQNSYQYHTYDTNGEVGIFEKEKRFKKLKKLLDEELITPEEYQEAISKL